MRRFAFLSVVVAAGFIAAACSGGSSDSTAPQAPAMADRHGYGWHEYHHTRVYCKEFQDDLMQDLFPRRMRNDVRQRIHDIRFDYRRGRTTTARTEMYQLWSDVLAAFYAGSLTGGMSSDTQDNVLQFGQYLYCLVGLDGSDLALGDALGTGDVTQVVFPSGSDQDVVHGSGNGGVRIPGGDLTQPVTVTVSLITDSFDPFTGPLNTNLDQYGPFFEFHVIPAGAISAPVLVAECLTGPGGATPPNTVHLAHNVGTGIEILGIETSFLSCLGSGALPTTMHEFLARRDFSGALRQLGSRALSLVTPADAWAGSLGVGGKTSSFSPYGGVDTAVVMEATSSTVQLAPAGSDVASPPTVRVHTTGANTSLPGANVTFSVTAGGGTLGAGHTSSVSGVTDGTGSFGVTSWTVAAGANEVQATGAFPAPPSGTGVGINGSPVTFTATGGDLIPWEASGYKYLVGPADHDAGFEALAFNDAAWSIGQGGFSDHLAPGIYCAIDTTGRTFWNSVPEPTDMLLRHTFSLPSGWSTDLKVSVAIDNDIEVFVDGTMISGEGFVTHEGCATRDSFIFTVPAGALSTGTTTHVLAIRARDRGVAAFVDVRLYVPTGD